ncbi:conserved exported protein of unknown function [Nitrospira sp. KM1]|uniref:hypothetical protein n=1 Tax=Nitrospira sp. KM1 TaxID=1936990 RepID=UPI0013A74710|nr:hypothetical protein [Nitrospira sp. KM1]BCA54833.1 conserved exported protein of unknown function [Nitrospira sp. KM1]
MIVGAGNGIWRRAVLMVVLTATYDTVWAIDVKISMEDAQKALEAGRAPMEKANTPDEVKKVLQQASLGTRVGADPEKDACGASAVLRTKRYRLEAFGRQEASESKKRKSDIRMPDEFIKKVVDMPNMEVEVQLCGDDEYFAEDASIELQQGSKRIKAIPPVGKAERGRKNEGTGPAYRSRFTALFAYESFDPNAASVFVINLQDGKEIRINADFSKVK